MAIGSGGNYALAAGARADGSVTRMPRRSPARRCRSPPISCVSNQHTLLSKRSMAAEPPVALRIFRPVVEKDAAEYRGMAGRPHVARVGTIPERKSPVSAEISTRFRSSAYRRNSTAAASPIGRATIRTWRRPPLFRPPCGTLAIDLSIGVPELVGKCPKTARHWQAFVERFSRRARRAVSIDSASRQRPRPSAPMKSWVLLFRVNDRSKLGIRDVGAGGEMGLSMPKTTRARGGMS